jgi:hypothetical protein
MLTLKNLRRNQHKNQDFKIKRALNIRKILYLRL